MGNLGIFGVEKQTQSFSPGHCPGLTVAVPTTAKHFVHGGFDKRREPSTKRQNLKKQSQL